MTTTNKLCQKCEQEPTTSKKAKYCARCRRAISVAGGQKQGRKNSATSKGASRAPMSGGE